MLTEVKTLDNHLVEDPTNIDLCSVEEPTTLDPYLIENSQESIEFSRSTRLLSLTNDKSGSVSMPSYINLLVGLLLTGATIYHISTQEEMITPVIFVIGAICHYATFFKKIRNK